MATQSYWIGVQPGVDMPHLQMPKDSSSRSLSCTPRYSEGDIENSRLTVGTTDDDDSDGEDDIALKNDPVEEDTYGFMIASVVRDLHWLTKGTEVRHLRIARLTSSFCLMLFTLGLQTFLLHFVRTMLTARSVHDIRHIYSEYEKFMYPDHTTTLHHAGITYYRGIPGYRDDKRFEELDGDIREEVCEIPLSQPVFLGTVLLVWSMTCVVQLKQTVARLKQTVILPPTVKSMQFATKKGDDDPRTQIVKGLTREAKVTLTVCVFFPQLFITCYLLWLGSRWLVATADLEELLLNAVALEFVLNLKENLYTMCVPLRSKLETQNTYVLPGKSREKISWLTLFGAFYWGLMAVSWVLFYLRWQRVLVDYQWDIGDLCAEYLANGATV